MSYHWNSRYSLGRTSPASKDSHWKMHWRTCSIRGPPFSSVPPSGAEGTRLAVDLLGLAAYTTAIVPLSRLRGIAVACAGAAPIRSCSSLLPSPSILRSWRIMALTPPTSGSPGADSGRGSNNSKAYRVVRGISRRQQSLDFFRKMCIYHSFSLRPGKC